MSTLRVFFLKKNPHISLHLLCNICTSCILTPFVSTSSSSTRLTAAGGSNVIVPKHHAERRQSRNVLVSRLTGENAFERELTIRNRAASERLDPAQQNIKYITGGAAEQP